MLIQYLENHAGDNIGVYIPINDWKIIKQKLKELSFFIDEKLNKEMVLSDLKEAFKEVKEHQSGKKKMKTAKDFLDEI